MDVMHIVECFLSSSPETPGANGSSTARFYGRTISGLHTLQDWAISGPQETWKADIPQRSAIRGLQTVQRKKTRCRTERVKGRSGELTEGELIGIALLCFVLQVASISREAPEPARPQVGLADLSKAVEQAQALTKYVPQLTVLAEVSTGLTINGGVSRFGQAGIKKAK